MKPTGFKSINCKVDSCVKKKKDSVMRHWCLLRAIVVGGVKALERDLLNTCS